jgi:acyl carrier protein
MDAVEQELRIFVVETFLFGQGGDELNDDDSLLELGIVDSTGVLEIVAFLEEKWSIGVEDEELVPENFDSLSRLTVFVGKKLGKTGG